MRILVLNKAAKEKQKVNALNVRMIFNEKKLSYDVAVIQWITSCCKNRMTTRVITLWRVDVMSLTTSTSVLK